MNNKIRKLIDKGFFHIFLSSLINKFVLFFVSIVLVRVLSKNQFGIFSYSYNIVQMFMLFSGIGVTSGVLQFASETDNIKEQLSYFRFGVKRGLLFNVLLSLMILVFPLFYKIEIDGAPQLIQTMFILPIFMLVFQLLLIFYRVTLENKKFSLLNTLNTILLFLFSVIGAYYFKLKGVVVARYLAYIVTIVAGYKLSKNIYNSNLTIDDIPKKKKKEFMKFSAVSSFNNAIAHLLYTIDVFLIGLIIVDELVIASYKTATLIPFALNFIPASIVSFIYPYFAKKNKDKAWIRENYLKLTLYIGVFNFLVSSILFIFAPLIIKIFFGVEYLDSVEPFRILAIGYFIAGTFRIPGGNIIVMMKKVKFGMYLSIFSGLINIILDVLLIRSMGSIGAAIATVSVFLISSIFIVGYLLKITKDDSGLTS